jgi:carotenoid cleavage dioxygenase-like enzyme
MQLNIGIGPHFIDCYSWKKNAYTELLVLDKKNGQHITTLETNLCFIFHTNNAYEIGNDIIIDAHRYPNPNIIESLYFENTKKGK